MKDGDVSLILKDVTTADAGIYEIRISPRTKRRRRANLGGEPICSIYLRVDPPGQTGGRREGGDNGGHPGLVASRSFLVLLLLLLGVVLIL
ncbi:unnamed protein product [Oreochromis niloticus]|nr:unnamed protein product [Mustela putorius furo]